MESCSGDNGGVGINKHFDVYISSSRYPGFAPSCADYFSNRIILLVCFLNFGRGHPHTTPGTADRQAEIFHQISYD